MVLKITALGFIINKGSYLRNSWNIVDFAVVIAAYLPYILDNSQSNLSALRSLRVLRPLRTVNKI